MDLSLTLQYVVIALAVLLSLWVVMKKQFPARCGACVAQWRSACCAMGGLHGCGRWAAA